MQNGGQNGQFRKDGSPSNPGSPTLRQHDEKLHPFYPGKEHSKQQGVLNRTFSTLNPFKVVLGNDGDTCPRGHFWIADIPIIISLLFKSTVPC